jgi:seryl-tRNA synthetase
MHGGKNGDPFTKNFVLKDATGKRLWTGCTGFGVTRWITAFLAQKGFDTKNWPKRIRELFEEE